MSSLSRGVVLGNERHNAVPQFATGTQHSISLLELFNVLDELVVERNVVPDIDFVQHGLGDAQDCICCCDLLWLLT